MLFTLCIILKKYFIISDCLCKTKISWIYIAVTSEVAVQSFSLLLEFISNNKVQLNLNNIEIIKSTDMNNILYSTLVVVALVIVQVIKLFNNVILMKSVILRYNGFVILLIIIVMFCRSYFWLYYLILRTVVLF